MAECEQKHYGHLSFARPHSAVDDANVIRGYNCSIFHNIMNYSST